MLANPRKFIKMMSISNSCTTKKQLLVSFQLARKFRAYGELTEFEYMAIEKILLSKLDINITSRWNQKIDYEKIIEKSDLR